MTAGNDGGAHYLLNELIGKDKSTPKYRTQNHGQMERQHSQCVLGHQLDDRQPN